MSVIKWRKPEFNLQIQSRENLISSFQEKLKGRVVSAYFFGSFARDQVYSQSDLDILLIVEDNFSAISFVERPKLFSDLQDIFPAIDLLVYTERELKHKDETDNKQGHWKEVIRDRLQFL